MTALNLRGGCEADKARWMLVNGCQTVVVRLFNGNGGNGGYKTIARTSTCVSVKESDREGRLPNNWTAFEPVSVSHDGQS